MLFKVFLDGKNTTSSELVIDWLTSFIFLFISKSTFVLKTKW